MSNKLFSLTSILVFTCSSYAISKGFSEDRYFAQATNNIQAIIKMGASDSLNAFINLNPNLQYDAKKANSLAKQSHGSNSSIYGLPMVIKDNIHVSGLATTAGTPGLKDNIVDNDARVVQKLKQAGVLIVGKTNMHELAAGVTSNNFFYGPVRLPYCHQYFAGGSSGGTAVAISSGIVSAGLGTDTAGSIRIPAALNGLIGFRPTVGRYSTTGVIPASKTFDTIGIMANKMELIEQLDSVLAENTKTKALLDTDKPIRIGIPEKYFYENLDTSTNKDIKNALEKLRNNAGIQLIHIDLSNLMTEVRQSSNTIALYEFPIEMKRYLNQYKPNLSFDTLVKKIKSPDVKKGFEHIIASPIAKRDYEDIIKTIQPKLKKQYRQIFIKNRLDVIAFPTTPLPSRKIEGSLYEVLLNGKMVSTIDIYTRNTILSPVLGTPAITIPISLKNKCNQTGLEIDGLAGEDEKVLAITKKIYEVIHLCPPSLLSIKLPITLQ